MTWYQKASQYIETYAINAYRQQRAAHLKAGRRVSTFRYTPDTYHRAFVKALGQPPESSEETLKAMMLFPDMFKD